MRTAIRSIIQGLGTSVVFVAATVLGAVAHLDAPPMRRAIVARVNTVLASVLTGRIVIEHVGTVGSTAIDDVDARVEDAAGTTVLKVGGLHARVSTLDLLRSLGSGPDVRVVIDELSVVHADVNLDGDETGALRLANAFSPANTSASAAAGTGGGVRLTIPHALLLHVAAHGRPPAGPRIDAYVDGSDVAVKVTPGHVALEVTHALIAERNLSDGLTTLGMLDARFEQPAPDGSDRFAHASWKGLVGALAGTANATYDAGRIDAVVDVPAATPECVRGLWASCPFGDTSSAHAEVHGALPDLLVDAHARVGRGSIAVWGQVAIAEETRASLRLTATSIDAHALAPTAPATDLSASGDVLLVATGPGPARGSVLLDFGGGTVGEAQVPAARITGQFDRDENDALTAQASVAVDEPGAPATAVLHLSPAGASFLVAFDASADAPRLDAIARLGPVAKGSARSRAHGTLDLGTDSLDAHVEASVSSLRVGADVRLDQAALKAHASGPMAAPTIDALLTGRGLDAGPLSFDAVQAQWQGSTESARATLSLRGHDADIVGSGTVGLRGGTTLRGLRVAIEHNGETAHAEASTVRLAENEASVDDLVIEGLGAPLRATVQLAPGSLTAKAESKGLDLARLGRLAGVSPMNGRVSLDVDAAIRGNSARGRVLLDLAQGSFAGWHDAEAHLDATIDGLHAAGHVAARAGGIGTMEASSSSLQIGAAGPLQESAWRTAWGEIDLTAHVDLARLSAQLPNGTIPMGNLAGMLEVKGRVERDSSSDSTPEVELTAGTTSLAFIGSPIPWRIDGIDATVHSHVDGSTGATSLEVELADRGGALVGLQASSDSVPYARLFTADEAMESALLAMPFKATVNLPPHELAKLPAFLGTHGMEGNLDASIDWQGSVDKPIVDLRAALAHGRAAGTVLALPVDVTLAGHYDGSHADASLVANARGQRVLEGGAGLDLRMSDLLAGGEPPWKASAQAKLTAFPLQSLAPLDDRQVRGLADGTFQVDGLHDDAKAKVSLTLTDLKVGEIMCRPTTLQASMDGTTIDATARIVEEDGFAEGSAHLGSHWGKALLPTPDTSQPTDVKLTAKSFRVAVLLPFVSQIFTELDGRIDGNVRVLVDPVAKTIKPEGTIALNGGVFEVSALGSELHDASAKVVLTPDGVVRLENASARGLSGRVEAAATARLQGTELVSAQAQVQVSKKEPLPLVFDGVQVGMVDGRMDLTMARGSNGLDVNAEVPSLRLQLPVASTHSVQALGALPGVRVGIAERGRDFAVIGLDGGDTEIVASSGPRTPTRVTVHLGKDVEVRRGSDLDVRMDGKPTITLGETVTATGQIRLTHGTLNVQGKTFTIDNGTVTFIDDPTNPQVVLTASWASSDASGTTVFADFVGPLKTGKVTLRSEPALGQSEILSLLLYGTTDQQAQGGSGAAGSPQVGAASGVAGGAASANINRALGGLNQALDNLGLSTEISTKLDTSQTTPRPEVEVQIARDLSFQIAWVLGVPPPGTNPDQTLFTIAWRFLRQWQAETTVGDAGTTILDLVWQRRY